MSRLGALWDFTILKMLKASLFYENNVIVYDYTEPQLLWCSHLVLLGKSKLANMTWSVSLTPWPLTLAPHFVNNDYVTAEITYSTVHVHHNVLIRPQATFVLWVYISFTWEGPGGLCGLMLCYVCCYSCDASQERIIGSKVPTAPHIFFQPLGLCLTYHGFREQCRQWGIARQLIMWAESTRQLM